MAGVADAVEPYWKSADERVAIYCADATQMLGGVTFSAIGTVISDPPWYGMEFAHQLALGIRSWSRDEEAIWLAQLEAFYWEWLPHLRTLVEYNNGRAFLFASPHHAPAMARMAFLAGWPLRRIWYAPESEALMQFGRPINDDAAQDVGHYFAMSPHLNKTDEYLLDAMLACSEGTVLDPFCGTGTVLIEARKAGRSAIGIEARAETCALAKAALEIPR